MPLVIHVQAGAGLRSRAGRPVLQLLKQATRATLQALAVTDAEISLTLLDDTEITRLNREWLNRDRATDVLAFPLYEGEERPVGDVYIGVKEAGRQAERRGIPLEQELARLAVHGTLHVLGHDHPEGRGREQSAMWKLQETILSKVMRA